MVPIGVPITGRLLRHCRPHLLDRLIWPFDQRLALDRDLELVPVRQPQPVAQHIAAARRVLPCNTDAFFSEPGFEAFQR